MIPIAWLKAHDQFHENRKRRARERDGAIASAHAEGFAEGRAEIIQQLRERGIDVDMLLSLDNREQKPPETP